MAVTRYPTDAPRGIDRAIVSPDALPEGRRNGPLEQCDHPTLREEAKTMCAINRNLSMNDRISATGKHNAATTGE